MALRSQWIAPLSWGVLLIVAPAGVGYLLGWFTGASRSPVVGSILPLVFSLIGGLGVGVLSKRLINDEAVKQLKELPVVGRLSDVEQAELIQVVKRDPQTPVWLPAVCGFGVLCFCLTCYLGAHAGIALRSTGGELDAPKSLDHYLGEVELRPNEWASIQALLWKFQAAGVNDSEISAFVNNVVKPAAALEDANRKMTIDDLVKQFAALDKSDMQREARERGFPLTSGGD